VVKSREGEERAESWRSGRRAWRERLRAGREKEEGAEGAERAAVGWESSRWRGGISSEW
jgi:hypothetical protein